MGRGGTLSCLFLLHTSPPYWPSLSLREGEGEGRRVAESARMSDSLERHERGRGDVR